MLVNLGRMMVTVFMNALRRIAEDIIFAARIRGPVTDLLKVALAVGETNELRDSAFQSKSPNNIAHRERRVFRPVSR